VKVQKESWTQSRVLQGTQSKAHYENASYCTRWRFGGRGDLLDGGYSNKFHIFHDHEGSCTVFRAKAFAIMEIITKVCC